MSHAKRMVLVDEDTYHRKKETWKKPIDENVKSKLHRDLKTYYENNDLPDDIKAKEYQQTLQKFLNVKRTLPIDPPANVIARSARKTLRRTIRTIKIPKWLEL
jgi:hypothetical protein